VRRVEGCYLLHFDSKVHGAQHYLGWSVHIARRIRQHLKGDGARLVRQALRAGICVELVRVWTSADRKYERVLKVRAPKSYCPKCRRRPEPVAAEVLLLLTAARVSEGLRERGDSGTSPLRRRGVRVDRRADSLERRAQASAACFTSANATS
jgi:predicted GIY-YIG superfamily endonuclease